MTANLELAQFDIDPERGFLPAQDPLRELPSLYGAWEELAHDLPRLLLAGRLRRAVDAMPLLDPAGLSTPAAARRAMSILSFLGHGYVWNGDTPSNRIPARLAIPWVAVAQALGRPPVLSYQSYAADNWRRFDPSGPLELDNLALLQNFLGGADEDWFILIHVAIEARAAAAIAAMGPAQEAAQARDLGKLSELLANVAGVVRELGEILARMPEHCDPYIYYRRVRPYIHGWKDHPELPDGVTYEGVEQTLSLRGETGAQSAIVPSLDAFLGVEHASDPLRLYLDEMRSYQPPGHRRFARAVASGPSVREVVAQEGDARRELVAAYDECIHWLESFRRMHAEYAARYIHQQSQTSPSNPTSVGTGGTPFMPYLRKHRDETRQHSLG